MSLKHLIPMLMMIPLLSAGIARAEAAKVPAEVARFCPTVKSAAKIADARGQRLVKAVQVNPSLWELSCYQTGFAPHVVSMRVEKVGEAWQLAAKKQ